MPNILSIIGTAWGFIREQSTMGATALLYIFVPNLLSTLLPLPVPTDAVELKVLLILIHVLLALVLIFGVVCGLTIGKRLLQAKSGRKKTSFKSVQKNAAEQYIPLLLTGILRTVFTLFWGLPIVIVASGLFRYTEGANTGRLFAYAFLVLVSALPLIRYTLLTSFYGVLSVCEGISYREGLKESKNIFAPHFWAAVRTVLLLTIILVVPAQMVATLLTSLTIHLEWWAQVVSAIAASFLLTLSVTLYIPSIILIYKHFAPHAKGQPVTGTIN